jgi:prepilin-type processing-associated H-X9-DG protein
MGLALHNYHDQLGSSPSGVQNPNEAPNIPGRPKGYHPYWSWMALLMPYYEQDNLNRVADTYAHIGPGDDSDLHWWPWGDLKDPPTVPPNPALGTLVAVWTCPADNRTLQTSTVTESGFPPELIAFTAYLGVSGIRGDDYTLFGSKADKSGILFGSGLATFKGSRNVRMAEVTDGLSNTLMVGERPPSVDLAFGWWFAGAGYDGSGTADVVLGAYDLELFQNKGAMRGTGIDCSAFTPPASKLGLKPGTVTEQCDRSHFWSLHSGGANFLLGDGSVRFLNYSIDDMTFQHLCTRNGGEPVSVP